MDNNNLKYPRTYHLPWSPGATKDDKKLQDGWFESFRGCAVVFTEKLDGENTAMSSQDVYARSHSVPTRSPWSRNMWDAQSGLFWRVQPFLGQNEMVYGENLYGIHSIEYNALTSYWHMFAANDSVRWYSWDEVVEMSRILDVKHVPVICEIDSIESPEQIKEIIDKAMSQPSAYGEVKEGVVMRLRDSFPIDAFASSVCKWVRPNHVQTDEHWTRNWKKAELKNE